MCPAACPSGEFAQVMTRFSPAVPPRLHASSLTHAGKVRSNNEDSMFVNTRRGIFAVADGMGGAAAGEVASAMFVERVADIPNMLGKSQAVGVEFVKDTFIYANQDIIQHVEESPHHAGMGCTAELLLFCNDGYVLGHVGDSRTYLFRDHGIRRLGRDHTLVQAQLDQGMLSAEEAAGHPYRNVLLRAVGINETLMVDIIRGQYRSRDVFLLCSDGLTDMISEAQLSEVVTWRQRPEDIAAQLVDKANLAGGRDNITVVVVMVE